MELEGTAQTGAGRIKWEMESNAGSNREKHCHSRWEYTPRARLARTRVHPLTRGIGYHHGIHHVSGRDTIIHGCDTTCNGRNSRRNGCVRHFSHTISQIRITNPQTRGMLRHHLGRGDRSYHVPATPTGSGRVIITSSIIWMILHNPMIREGYSRLLKVYLMGVIGR